jgi:crotonobetainyl-CoA:carnitine CoA-transferase CaiB-like acyl-CoA transferase
MRTALEGVSILDLTRLLPGGYATLLMADMGADVVKVEEPGRGDYIRSTPPMVDGTSAAHIALNRNKRSITLNLKTDAGRAALTRMTEHFDVLVEGFRPGVMDRLGLGYDELSGRSPGIVYCSITGYGQDGPRSQDAGHDLNYIGWGGVLSITGTAGATPVVPGVQVGDLGAGAMSAVVAILAALLQRSRTGRGAFCDISMLDGVVSWLSIHAAAYFATGDVPSPDAMPLNGGLPCYRIYPAADGYVTVGALEPQFWSGLCDALDRPDLLGDAFAAGERRAWVISQLESIFRGRTRREWIDYLSGRDVCLGPVLNFEETFGDEHVRHRRLIAQSEVPRVGMWSHVATPAARADGDHRPPPDLGQHTDEVLTEMGMSAEDVDALRAAGAV